jgi:hypothetical protein
VETGSFERIEYRVGLDVLVTGKCLPFPYVAHRSRRAGDSGRHGTASRQQEAGVETYIVRIYRRSVAEPDAIAGRVE